MIVQHAFTVNAPSERVLAALLDLRTAVACLPGARLEAVDGQVASGRVRIPLAGTSMSYRGTLRLVESDPEAGSLRAALLGDAVHGEGTASADVELRLRESNGLTTASVRGEVEIDGRPPEADDAVLQRAAAGLLRRFGRCLEEAMADGAEPGARVDPEQRLEETIAALSQLERRANAPAGAREVTSRASAPRPEPEQAAEAPTSAPEASPAPPPVAPLIPERTVAGRVEVVTDGPVVLPSRPSRRDRVGDRVDDRPWLVPAGLISLLLAWVLLRRR